METVYEHLEWFWFTYVLSAFSGNVLKELVEGAGAVIRCDDFELGDPTISVRELWGAEFQVRAVSQ